jgi:N-acetylglutamate synthase-like GNAT family acetyltransferase
VNEYLKSSDIIDWRDPSVLAKAHELADSSTDDEVVAERCFLWVRDHIWHSRDHRIPVVTCSASEVLRYGSGYCYAKSHLLAALLRANGIPTALCYQRLQVSDSDPRFCLHGLNSVHLKRHGWYRIDARGNKSGVDAAFCPPTERIAFPVTVPSECDLPGLFADPLPEIVEVLSTCATEDDVFRRLPDKLWPEPAPRTVQKIPGNSPKTADRILRRAIAADAPAIEALYRELVSDPLVRVLPEQLAELAESPTGFLIVVETGRSVCAAALLTICPDAMYGTQPFGVIENVIVAQSMRGLGFGRLLLAHVERLAVEQHCTKLMLLSSASREAAHAFFRQCGFTGDTKRAFVKYRSRFAAQ